MSQRGFEGRDESRWIEPLCNEPYDNDQDSYNDQDINKNNIIYRIQYKYWV